MFRFVLIKKRTNFSVIGAQHNATTPPVDDRRGASFWGSVQPLFLLALFVLPLLFPPSSWASSPKLSSLIGKVARQEGLDPNLLSAVVATESQFDVASVSTRGAVGLMQLMPDTARELGVVNRFNPEQNLRGGARYLRRMMERYPDNLSLALAAYNAGPTAVIRFGGVPPFPETKRYIHKVLGRYAKMVPGRNRSPKRSFHHIRPKKKNLQETMANSQKEVVRPEGPLRAPKLVHTVKKLAAKPVTRHQMAAHKSPSEKKGESATPVLRLTRR